MALIEHDSLGLFTRVCGWISRPAYPSRLSAGARVSARILGNTPLVAMGEGPHKRCLEIWVAVCLDAPNTREPSSQLDHYVLCLGELWLSIPELNPSLASQDTAKLGAQFLMHQSALALSAGASYQLPNAIHNEGMRRMALMEHSEVIGALSSVEVTTDSNRRGRL